MLSEKDFIHAIRQHQNIPLKVCNLYMNTRADREDLFQEILMNAWKGIKNFRGDAKFSTWLYRVALNTALTYLKKNKNKPLLVEEQFGLFFIPDEKEPLEDQLIAMNMAIAELSEVDKALVMLYLDDLSYREMAEITGITANNVAVKMNRIKARLRENSKKHL